MPELKKQFRDSLLDHENINAFNNIISRGDLKIDDIFTVKIDGISQKCTAIHLVLMVGGKHCNDKLKKILAISKTHIETAIDGDEKGASPLKIAIESDNTQGVDLLVKAGVNLSRPIDKTGRLALIYAIYGQKKNVIPLLVKPENISLADLDGTTPLKIACLINDKETVELLLLNGANFNPLELSEIKLSREIENILSKIPQKIFTAPANNNAPVAVPVPAVTPHPAKAKGVNRPGTIYSPSPMNILENPPKAPKIAGEQAFTKKQPPVFSPKITEPNLPAGTPIQQGFPIGQHPMAVTIFIDPDVTKLVQIGNLFSPSSRPAGKNIVIVDPINENLKSGPFSLHHGGVNGMFHDLCGIEWVKGPYKQAFGKNKIIPSGTAKKVPAAGELLKNNINEVVLSAGPQARSDKYIIENGAFNEDLYVEDLKKCFLAVAYTIENPQNTQLYFPVMGGGIFNKKNKTEVLPPEKMAELQRMAYEQAWNENPNFALMQPVIMVHQKDVGYVQHFPNEFANARLNPIQVQTPILAHPPAAVQNPVQNEQLSVLTESYHSYQPPEDVTVDLSSSEDLIEKLTRELQEANAGFLHRPEDIDYNPQAHIPPAPSYKSPQPPKAGYSQQESQGKNSPENLYPGNRFQERQ